MKKTTTDNPFLLYGYSSPECFCDRVEETKELVEAIKNGRNGTGSMRIRASRSRS